MRGYVRFAMAAAFMAGVLMFPGCALEAARAAMANWALCVAPSLFPFAAVLPYLTSREARQLYDRLLGRVTRLLFNLPGGCASAIVTGFAAGSPACAMAVARVSREEHLTRGQAARLAGIACGVGPVYVVSGIGVALAGSAQVGWRLAISQWAALIATGIVFRGAWKGDEASDVYIEEDAREKPMTAAVGAILRVCGYMTLFSVLLAVLTGLIGEKVMRVSPVLDLPTGAAWAVANNIDMIFVALALGSGGLCIAFQNMASLVQAGVSWRRYLAQKAVSAGVCAAAWYAQTRLDIGVSAGAFVERTSLECSALILCAVMLPVLAISFSKNTFLNNE